jgi:hypothetical protein
MNTWLAVMLESSALLGATLRILHPEQYHASMKALQAFADSLEVVKEEDQVLQMLRLWASPYSSYSIVSNRMSVVLGQFFKT